MPQDTRDDGPDAMTGSTSPLLLALDVGTQSVRALAFDLAGNLAGGARVAIEPYVSPHPGWADNDPELYWDSLAAACARLWQSGIARESIAAVVLTTQRNTVIVTDGDGRPLRPAIVWVDQRRTYGLPPLGGLYGIAFRVAGVRETVAAFQADCELNWIRQHEPEVWSRIRRYLFLSGYLTERLTGRFVDSVANQVGYVPFDFRRMRWAGRRDWKWQVAPFDPSWLPELVPPTGVLGEVTAEASAATGIPAGLPLVAAAGDKSCEGLGAGALEPHIGALSLGTAATFSTTHRRYVEAVPMVPPFPAAVPGAWALEMSIYRGFWMVEWFKRQIGGEEVARAAELGVEPETLFEALLEESPPGAMGLMLQPYWSPGVRIPGPEAKGAIIGFGDVHTRAHVYRAILEGLAYGLREAAETSARRTGVPVTELRVSGGGSQSPATVQLAADVFGLPAGRPHTHETSGLGAAVIGSVGVNLHRDVPTAVAAMTRLAEIRDPDPVRHALYDQLYERVYKRMYGRLQPLYEEIRRITGYPADPSGG
jgi:sugar (pentulose or hexulose) kinase